jgi:hypothetical protein
VNIVIGEFCKSGEEVDRVLFRGFNVIDEIAVSRAEVERSPIPGYM